MPSTKGRASRQGKYSGITEDAKRKLIEHRETGTFQVLGATMDVVYGKSQGLQTGHARRSNCKIPEEQGIPLKAFEVGLGSGSYFPRCTLCIHAFNTDKSDTPGHARLDKYAHVPTSTDGVVDWVLDPEKTLVAGPPQSVQPRCATCGIPRWASEALLSKTVVWSAESKSSSATLERTGAAATPDKSVPVCICRVAIQPKIRQRSGVKICQTGSVKTLLRSRNASNA